MEKFTEIIKRIRDGLYHKIVVSRYKETEADKKSAPSPPPIERSYRKEKEQSISDIKKRDPYFIQIGFDFGTSYSKCICRDMMTNKAWVHLSSKTQNQEFPFLIPSALLISKTMISHVEDIRIHYPENGLYHLKNALALVANGHLDNPSLFPYRNAVPLKNSNQLPTFIVVSTVYFLAGAIGEIRKAIRTRFPGFGSLPEDYMAINLAIPVENAQQPKVSKYFNQVLCDAWKLADELAGHPPIDLLELQLLWKSIHNSKNFLSDEACFVYPEVSANVQSFVRSRVSSPGIYLFSDIGGGTVDQSVFIFIREDHGEPLLTYLVGRVLPLGSSYIERMAAESNGVLNVQSLEIWKEKKERGENDLELRRARSWLANELVHGSEGTLALAKQKLIVKTQLNDIRLIFGGGGHCKYPYEEAVRRPFSGQLFHDTISPDIIGLPVPSDLNLKSHETKWMRRLSVAYGLSFEKSELARFIYPKDVSDPTPEEIWQPRKTAYHAPSKDEC